MSNQTAAESMLKTTLVCPRCLGRLEWSPKEIECTRCGRTYDIVDGIPIMLPADEHEDVAEKQRNHKRQQAEYFDENEDSDFEISRPQGTPRLYRWMLNEKFRRSMNGLKETQCRSALTVCGGSGMDAEFLSKNGLSVIASDISLGAARRALERASRFNVHLEAVVADVEQLPFADSSIDLVYVHDGLHHLSSPLTGLHEMTRVAARAISVTEPAKAVATAIAVKVGLSVEIEEAGNRVARLRLQDITNALEINRFRVLAAERYAMLYRHEPRLAMKLLSVPGIFFGTTVAWRGLNGLIGRIGNKLTVQAVRQPLD